MEYRTSAQGVDPEQLVGFFEGWPSPPSPERHLALLRGSSHVVLAVEAGTIVGFVTAISDGVLADYIPLLEVRREWRGRGVGTGLVQRVLAELDGLYMVDVVCDPNLIPDRCPVETPRPVDRPARLPWLCVTAQHRRPPSNCSVGLGLTTPTRCSPWRRATSSK